MRAFGPWRSLRFNDVEQGLTYVVEGEGEEARADASALPFEYLRVMTAAATGGVAHRGVDLCAREAVDAQLFACTVRLRSLGSAASSSSSTRRRNQSKRALHDWSGQNLERCYASETFWRFADCDAVLETRKSDFFGNPRRDVGLYEFFKAQLHTPAYKPLMMHTHASTLSEIDISETEYRRRFVVTRGQENSEDEAVYEIHMRLRPNGIWYTERLLRDDGDT